MRCKMSFKALSATPNLEAILLDAKGKASEYEYLMWEANRECAYIYLTGKFQNEDYYPTYEDFIFEYEKNEVCPYVTLKVVFL